MAWQAPIEMDRTDLLIIGAGSGAFAAAIRAAGLGARVTMVERGTMGGTCVNVGCVPSKTLIRAAEVQHLRSHHPFDGIPSEGGRVDIGPLVAQKRELVERLRDSKYRNVLSSYPEIEYVAGEAGFIDAGTVGIRRADGSIREIAAERIVIATGATTRIPSIAGIENVPYWTNVEALSTDALPATLAVAGGSSVGLELAQMFARLGSRVTLFAPVLVPGTDPEVGESIRSALEAEGIDVVCPARVTAVERQGARVEVVAEADGREERRVAERLLVATGRQANTRALGLDRVGVAVDDRGFIEVDSRLETSRPGIYAVGDCTTLPKYVYVAAKAGTIAAGNALTEASRELDLSAMPAVVFTSPQVAWVGLTEERAVEHGLSVETRTLPMGEVPRALANRDTRGLIKLVVQEGGRRLLGAQIVSANASEAIQTAALAIGQGMTVNDLVDTLFPYLTDVEGLKLAAQTFETKIEQLSCCAG